MLLRPIAIKKVQDDQEFDITQSEILGHLFTNTATIRVIQATANPSIRDSVPPTSALRFDPNTTRKRERNESAQPNGVSPSSAWKPNKRQRVSELDPDEPLPSRENEPERRSSRLPEVKVIPDSQDEGSSPRQFIPSRQVRQNPPRISETPSPPSSPQLQHSPPLANGSADQPDIKSEIQSQKDTSNQTKEIRNSSPLVQASERAHSNGSQRAKSASYHISRPTERGTSVSTAATSPFSVDQQTPTQNGLTSASKRKKTDPSPKPRPNANRSMNEDTIYDSIVSEDEGAKILRKKKSSLKMQNSPSAGLPGIDSVGSNNSFNTPPNGTRRPARSREGSSAGELPLTPNSKEREKRQQERHEADDAKQARKAAAGAAEQRRLEAEETRQVEEARSAKEERAKREEQERLEVEEFQREEAKRKAAIAKAARLQKEREGTEKKRLEEERIAKGKVESERIAKIKAEAKRLREEEERERQRQAGEAEKLHQEEERAERERHAIEEAMKKKPVSPGEQRQRHSPSPILPRGTPSSSIKPQSSTPYIPSGRKSALKSSLSSQSIPRSSTSSPEVSRGVGIEAQMPLPSKLNRKVSFDLHERKETPIKPPTRIVPPPKSTTPKASSPAVLATAKAPRHSTPRASQQGPGKQFESCFSNVANLVHVPVPPGRQSKTPIPVPSILKRPSLERSITPAGGRAIVAATPKEPSQQVSATRIAPPARSGSQKSETPIEPARKGKTPRSAMIFKHFSSHQLRNPSYFQHHCGRYHLVLDPANIHLAITDTIVISDSSNSDSGSDEDIPARVSPAKSAKSTFLWSKQAVPVTLAAKPEQSEDEDEEIGEDETQSHNSSIRDSRSPVVYSQHAKTESIPALRLPSPQLESNSEKENHEKETSGDDSEEDSLPTPKSKAKVAEMKDEEEESEHSESEVEESKAAAQGVDMKDDEVEESSVESGSESEGEGTEVQVPKSSPPILPTAKSSKVTSPKPSQANNSKDSITSEEMNIQDEIDQQLTSSVYEARSTVTSSTVPASSAIRPAIRVGASLSSMNSSKQLLASTSTKPLTPARGSQPAKVNMDEGSSDSEEEEDSDEEPASSSDEEPSKPMAAKVATKSQPKVAYSDSSGEESSESEDEQVKAGKELMAQLANMANGNSQVSLPSPKAYRSLTQQEGKKYGKKGEKKVDKYLTGQKFSMPKY